jgi:formylglycine-generating enzyme required for sulfatase activity
MGGDGPGEGPRHVVEVGSLYIARSPITNAQLEAFQPGRERAATSRGDDDPAVGVTFREALGYCEWYSRLSKKDFRLPTEAEWEYACRAGTTTRWPWGDDPAGAEAAAWDAENSGRRAHEVETLRANPAGLHDLIGNVWEWTSSLHRPYPVRPGDGRDALDVVGARVLRGGSFRSPREETGSAVRRAADEGLRADDVGFRIVRSL